VKAVIRERRMNTQQTRIFMQNLTQLTNSCLPQRLVGSKIIGRRNYGTKKTEDEDGRDLQTADERGPPSSCMIDEKAFWVGGYFKSAISSYGIIDVDLPNFLGTSLGDGKVVFVSGLRCAKR
jgi:hypothetical protein